MDTRSTCLIELFSLMAYISSIGTIVLSFLSTYAAGFGVIFAGVAAILNWRVQTKRLKQLQAKDLEKDT